MPRGWRDGHRPDATESQRGRPRLPLWKRRPSDNESSPPANSSLSDCRLEDNKVSQTTDGVDLAKASILLDENLYAPSNSTGTIDSSTSTYSPVNLQPETMSTPHHPDGVSEHSSLLLDSNVTSPSSTKPLSLLPFLAGLPSPGNGGRVGSVVLTPSVPQWMQFFNNQDIEREEQEISSGTPDGIQQIKGNFAKYWEKQQDELLKRQESLEEELELTKQAKEEAEQKIVNLERELKAKTEQVKELETTLSTAQQALDEYRRKEPCDWVISRNEIHMTDTCLGVGGWGAVVLGRFRGCKVAVKQIHELILSPHNRRLFEREMNFASRCRHPCLLQFIGATNDEGSPLFVTELMESSLRALLQQRPLLHTDISVISLDIAQALNYLHKSEPPIIHRDISSANVLLWRHGDQWRGKVSDYGTANFMQQTMTIAPGAMIYSSPEALTSNQTVKIDVYSFGVLVCEMCIQELPDPKQLEEQVALVTDHMFRGLIRRCIQEDPEARPDMEEIIDDLDSS